MGALAVIALAAGAGRAGAQLIVAHRGASSEAPENTLAAFRLAWKRGADAIEGDFRLTRDGRIVCCHDDSTLRTTGVDRKVKEATLAELRALDAGSWKGPAWRGERLPTLAEVLAAVPPGKKLFLEVKCGPEILPELSRVIGQSGLDPRRQVRIIAFDPEVIRAAKLRLPSVPAYWLAGWRRREKTKEWSPPAPKVLETLERIGADGLDAEDQPAVLTAAFARKVREAHRELHAWTVDDPAAARRLIRLGVASITTNRPAYLRRELAGSLRGPPEPPVKP